MSNDTLSHGTKEALDNIKAYLSSGNEAVQYAFNLLADLITQTPIVLIGGFPAGSIPASGVVTDSNGIVFTVDPAITGTFAGSISLNLNTGEVSAAWKIQQHIHYHRPRTVRGRTRRPAQPPVHVVVPQHDAGFYVLTTTNI